MLPFQNRLTKKTDFQKVYASRESFFAPGLTLKFIANDLTVTRVGFSVEKKWFKKAVERNWAKRKLRESTRPLLKKIKSGLDIVIIAKDPRSVENFGKLQTTVQELFVKSKLI
jgi:ribonuclease P protein component